MSTELFLNTNCRLSKQQQFKIYYRWRKQIVDKIYNLYVLAADVMRIYGSIGHKKSVIPRKK